jgi:hypothetical protein
VDNYGIMIACSQASKGVLDHKDRRCDACGQAIPAAAKLAAGIASRRHARTLGIQTGDGDPDSILEVTLCLNCRIHLAKISR